MTPVRCSRASSPSTSCVGCTSCARRSCATWRSSNAGPVGSSAPCASPTRASTSSRTPGRPRRRPTSPSSTRPGRGPCSDGSTRRERRRRPACASPRPTTTGSTPPGTTPCWGSSTSPSRISRAPAGTSTRRWPGWTGCMRQSPGSSRASRISSRRSSDWGGSARRNGTSAGSRSRPRRSIASGRRATALRCRALIAAAGGDLDAAQRAAEASVGLLEGDVQPFETARSLLVLGQIHRRGKRKRLAREYLGRAEAAFHGLGARLWADRANAELARIGGRPSTPFELTEAERNVASLVARGYTNQEAADALFISASTVQASLKRIYHKLDVRSRTELAAKIGQHAED